MDAGKLLRERMRGMAVYKSNWQARDASEVTLRHRDISNANNNVLFAGSTHHGPLPECCTGNTVRVPLPNPGKGFSTTYSGDIVTLRRAGCVECQDPVFGCAGSVEVKPCCVDSEPTPWQPDPLIYGAYITNSIDALWTNTDSQGNNWIVGSASNPTLPVSLYNRYGELIKTITNDINATNMLYVAFVSPDGVSLLWIVKIYIGTTFLSVQQQSIYDSAGNFIVPFLIGASNVSTPNRFILFDKNDTQVFSYEGSLNDTTLETFLLKLSPTGTWSGNVSDPNTWVVRIYNTSETATNFVFAYSLLCDSENNIIIATHGVNSSGVAKTLQAYDKTNTPFGTAVNIPSGANIRKFVLYKIAAAGTAAGSWNSYVFNTVAAASYNYFRKTMAITSTNNIVVTFNYTTTGNELRDAQDVRIGNTLPFAFSTGNGWYTCVAVYSPDGLAATSSRAVVLSQTSNRAVTPDAILLDSSDNIFLVAFAESGLSTASTIEAYIKNTDGGSGITFASNFYNIFIVKYNSSLAPQWISSVRGTNPLSNTVIAPPGATNNVVASNQNINAFLDLQQNIVVKGTFRTNTISYHNTAGTLVRTIGSTSATGSDSFIWKQPNDGTQGVITRIGFVTTEGVTVIYDLQFDSNNNIIISGWYNDSPVGFFTASNDSTPAVQITREAADTLNQFLAIYTPTLSSVTIAHISLLLAGTAGTPTPAYPFFTLIQDTNTMYLVGQYQGPISIYNFGNYSATPDFQRTNSGSFDTYICKFSLAGDTWVTTVQGTGNDSTAISVNTLYQVSQRFKVFDSGRVSGVIFSAVRPTVFDRTEAVVTSMFDDQTATPSPIAFQLSIPASGYGLIATESAAVVPKSTSCYCADPGIYRQPFPTDCSIVAPAYTGANNNVTTYGQNYGHLPKQQYPYPSG
jgi:hypothetical protein